MPNTDIASIPHLGSGIGFREEIADHILKASPHIDFIEVITEGYVNYPARLEQISDVARLFPVIPHGVGMSIGSLGEFDESYMHGIKRVSDTLASPYYSDHLCMTQVPGIDLGHLAPLWFCRELLNHIRDRVNHVQDYLGKPLILENITYAVNMPNMEITQLEFINKLADSTGCGILLDVTNVYTNSVNHGFDARSFIDSLPLNNVVQVHLAGGYWHNGRLVDGHSHPVPDEVWDLYSYLTSITRVKATLLEHDANFPDDFEVLLNQVRRARSINSQG
ncbi:DUF692 domain-containing protein [Streptomyces sp. NPDC056069]|uniref:DUF692 domain-containing protein n=1 Tax=Streptomyces sp. NPDC056069 TaxID=3345702 RepID=UPI0035E32457